MKNLKSLIEEYKAIKKGLDAEFCFRNSYGNIIDNERRATYKKCLAEGFRNLYPKDISKLALGLVMVINPLKVLWCAHLKHELDKQYSNDPRFS